MVRSFGKVESDMKWSIQDPAAYRNPYELWNSKEYARLSAEFVRQTMPQPGVDLTAMMEREAEGTDVAAAMTLGSNHNVIVDAEGNWISSLHTGHGGAPGIFIDGVRATGSGVKAETMGPGRRILAEVTGVFVMKDGKPWLSLGTPGFPPQPVTEVLVNILDFGMHPKEAADAPRFWAFLYGQTERRFLRIESRISDEVRRGMAKSGIAMEELGDYNWHTGSMQIIWRGDDGNSTGSATPAAWIGRRPQNTKQGRGAMRRSSTLIRVLAAVGVLALAATGTAQNGPDPQLTQGPKPTVTGDSVMVATQLPVVSNAALQVLKDGGNAVDAMVTAVFVQHVQDFQPGLALRLDVGDRLRRGERHLLVAERGLGAPARRPPRPRRRLQGRHRRGGPRP